MRKKIQRSMVMVLAVTLLLSYAIITIITYNRNMAMLEAEVRQEARYIQAAINISGPDYLAEMNGVDWTTRVTQISPEGEVPDGDAGCAGGGAAEAVSPERDWASCMIWAMASGLDRIAFSFSSNSPMAQPSSLRYFLPSTAFWIRATSWLPSVVAIMARTMLPSSAASPLAAEAAAFCSRSCPP